MDLAAPHPYRHRLDNHRPVAVRAALAAAATLAIAGGAALGVAAARSAAAEPARITVHRLQVGPAGVEYYDATAGAALGERVTDAYLELGGGIPFTYAKAGPFFVVTSSSDGTRGRLTVGTDFA